MITETKLGKIAGIDRDGVIAFRGIRYAEAPVGERRFKPPVPVGPWSDVYDATRFGDAAPQLQAEEGPQETISEDCLVLNVYTRGLDDARRPVMFWIHGGGYIAGSGRFYNGRYFVEEHDVVVVTINYRMGALGFMHASHLEAGLDESVNNGILDQLCALEWTRDNIRAFGGDPDNVTIFGESAGGTTTAMLLGCPRAEGLFHKAVVQSPNVDLIPVGDGHEAFTNRCIERLGGDPNHNGMQTLRDASIEDIVKLNMPGAGENTTASLAIRRPDRVKFSPAIDGSLIPRPVADTLRQRGAANVPLLAGGCRHEGTMFTYLIGDKDYTEAEAIELFNQEGFDGEQAMPVYETFAPGSTPREKLAYALTDTMFRNSTVRILDAVADSGGTCWSWMCTWENDQMNLRATHAIELSFLWNWIASVPLMAGNNPPRDLGPAMRAYWANFARTGTPSADGEPDWPSYNTKDRPVLLLDAKRRVENNLDDGVRKFWFQEAI